MLNFSTENLVHSVFQTLAYADIFDYPLTAPEVYRYLPSGNVSPEEVQRILLDETLFAQVDGYFTLPRREEIVEIRRRREAVAARLWRKARRYGQLIASLPFVRMVAVTGSLAVNNTDEGRDIDYLVVTAPGRLWTCRALILLVARIARLENVSLCPNYLVTTRALEFKERSLYVAHELVQMVPLAGMDLYREMLERNGWVRDFLPNAFGDMPPPQMQEIRPNLFMRKVLEFLLQLPIVAWFEPWEMRRKTERLAREQSSSGESYFSADVCKGHADRHGEHVVTALARRVAPIPLPTGEGGGEGQ